MMNKPKPFASAAPLECDQLFRAAYDATAGDRAVLSPDELPTQNLDIKHAVNTALGVVPKLAALRRSIAQHLPTFDLVAFDKIEGLARALAYTHSVYLAVSLPPEHLSELYERAIKIRELLLSDVAALAKRGLVDGARLCDLKGTVGYLNVASDVGVLARMLRESWVDIEHKTAATTSELDAAEKLCEALTSAVDARNQQRSKISIVADDRRRAFTALAKAYDSARRAATYLRWLEGDVDTIIPSLSADRGGPSDRTTSARPHVLTHLSPSLQASYLR
ncbi:MAG: hypothetical protein FWD73_01540 [Polyangiaceae bacterium]|nr:hypothetical protein [Polyangiaceae bacterium]